MTGFVSKVVIYFAVCCSPELQRSVCIFTFPEADIVDPKLNVPLFSPSFVKRDYL